MNPILELNNISFTYPNSNKGVFDVSLVIREKQKIAVLGLNGAGKSTLFLLLCGVFKPNTGEYFIEGKRFRFTKKERVHLGKKIGYVFQDPEVQLFATTVYDDIAFGVHNLGLDASEVKNRVEKYMDFLTISHLRDTAPHELSYGQKKLVAIAGVLVMEPKVIILDEPFAWLDVVQEKNMKNVLNELYNKGITIILSTHNIEFAKQWSDNSIIIEHGKCVQQGKTSEIDFKFH